MQVTEELLKYLIVADYSMREEIVLKTAVLAERFFPNLEWYVDSMLTLIERAGEFASKDVWCAAAPFASLVQLRCCIQRRVQCLLHAACLLGGCSRVLHVDLTICLR